jgi:hypothetical protein
VILDIPLTPEQVEIIGTALETNASVITLNLDGMRFELPRNRIQNEDILVHMMILYYDL